MKLNFKVIGNVLIVIGIIIVIFTFIDFFYNMRVKDIEKTIAKITVTIGMVITLVGRKLKAKEIKIEDTRAPIIYFRSFKDDEIIPDNFAQNFGVSESKEEALSHIFNQIGPFIALGKPNEKLPILGAHRIYLDKDNWQDTVTNLMRKSQLIILRIADTSGLIWELKNSIRIVDSSRIVLYFPHSIWKKNWKKKYNSFINKISNEILEIKFPNTDTINLTEFWIFDDNLNLIALSGQPNLWWYIRGWARGSEIGLIYAELSILFKRLGIPPPKIPISPLEWITIPIIILISPIFILGIIIVVIYLFNKIFCIL